MEAAECRRVTERNGLAVICLKASSQLIVTRNSSLKDLSEFMGQPKVLETIWTYVWHNNTQPTFLQDTQILSHPGHEIHKNTGLVCAYLMPALST